VDRRGEGKLKKNVGLQGWKGVPPPLHCEFLRNTLWLSMSDDICHKEALKYI